MPEFALLVRRKSNLKAKSRYFFTVTMSPPPPSLASSGGSGNHAPFAIPFTGFIVQIPSSMTQPLSGKDAQPLLTPTHPSVVLPSQASFQPSAASASVSVLAPAGVGIMRAFGTIASQTPRA